MPPGEGEKDPLTEHHSPPAVSRKAAVSQAKFEATVAKAARVAIDRAGKPPLRCSGSPPETSWRARPHISLHSVFVVQAEDPACIEAHHVTHDSITASAQSENAVCTNQCSHCVLAI